MNGSGRGDGPLCCARAVYDHGSGWSCPAHGAGASVPAVDDGAARGEPCGACQRGHSPERPVSWSPAFGVWLCGNCRVSRTDVELAATTRANLAAARQEGDAA